MDFDSNNYSKEDLLKIFDIDVDDKNITKQLIKTKAQELIKELQNDNEDNTYIKFIKNAEQTLLNEYEFDEWENNQYLIQNNNIQDDKITERVNKIRVFENNHVQMKQERLGINQIYQVPHLQGIINPNLKNSIKRTLLIDSKYRPNILPYSSDENGITKNTNFTFQLSEPINNVVSIKLNSYQIPTSWYAFDKNYGNISLEASGILLTIEEGNYTYLELMTELNSLFSSNSINLDVSFNSINNKYTIENTGGTDITIYFHKRVGFGDDSNTFMNQNLGWYMGYRIDEDENGDVKLIISGSSSEKAVAVADITGPKQLYLVVDDFNNNHLNNAIISMNLVDKKLKLPSYAKSRNDNVCDASGVAYYSKTAPRTLTQAQLYTINSIIEEDKNTEKKRLYGPRTNNVLGIISLKEVGNIRPDSIIEHGNNLEENKREYFGPVNIERLRIKLIDEKGNIVNLNDNDWSFSLIIEQLYQY